MNTLEIQIQVARRSGIDLVVCCADIDGEPIEDFVRYCYAIDLEELFRSERESGEFSIVTCWCGAPSCAGIGKGVHVRHEDGVVQWRLTDPGPIREYVFSESDYALALKNTRSEIKRFVANRRYSGEGPYELVAQYANEQYFRLGDEW